jgi:hypothetical protein
MFRRGKIRTEARRLCGVNQRKLALTIHVGGVVNIRR